MTGNIALREPSLAERRLWLSLVKHRERERKGLFLAEGIKVVRELFTSDWTAVSLLVVKTFFHTHREFWSCLPPGIPVYALPERDLRLISQDQNPEGIIAVVRDRSRQGLAPTARPENHALLLIGINNPGNLGAIMRTAHWFGIANIALSFGSVDYTNPKVVRASMGSIFHLKITADIDPVGYLRSMSATHRLVATSPVGGASPCPQPEPTLLILGSESHGLPPEIIARAQERWTLPGGGAESLSLPQAAAILLYELTRAPAPIRR